MEGSAHVLNGSSTRAESHRTDSPSARCEPSRSRKAVGSAVDVAVFAVAVVVVFIVVLVVLVVDAVVVVVAVVVIAVAVAIVDAGVLGGQLKVSGALPRETLAAWLERLRLY